MHLTIFSLFAIAFMLTAPAPVAAKVDKPKPFVTREEWGSKADPKGPYKTHTPKFITIHHSATRPETYKDPVAYILRMQTEGQSKITRKTIRKEYWPDLPYHFLIDPSGKIYEGRRIEYEPQTNTSYALTGNIGIELMGNFEKIEPTKAQVDALVSLTAWISQEHKIEVSNIRGHHDLDTTSLCPGKHLYNLITKGDFKNRVSALLNKK